MEIVKRGHAPKDAMEFGTEKAAKTLHQAAQEIAFLLDRGYEIKSASTFVGNHYLLSERQRMALARLLSPRAALEARREKQLQTAPERLVFDGFNTIITLEVALSGSLLLRGMDGTVRDLAGLRGTYRIVDKTHAAVELLLGELERLGVSHAELYLDRQVSNSGRLRSLLLDRAAAHGVPLTVTLHERVDAVLSEMGQVVTADAIILDHCKSWYNFNAPLIAAHIPKAWIFETDPTL